MIDTPVFVDNQVRYLLKRGRRLEALALLRIEWDAQDLARYSLEWQQRVLGGRWRGWANQIGRALIPAFSGMIDAINSASVAMAGLGRIMSQRPYRRNRNA